MWLVREAPGFVAVLIKAFAVGSRLLSYSHLLNEFVELDIDQCFRKAICNHFICWNIQEFNPF